MHDFSLSGKKILVTGASSGIGRQVAVTASSYGASVMVSGRNSAHLEETLNLFEKTGEHQVIPADLTDNGQLNSLIDALPVLNGLVYSAGITNHLPVAFIKQEDIRLMFDINYSAAVLLVRGLLKAKKIADHASLVFISSISLTYPYFGGALYNGTKAALESFSRILALELASKGIRSNCLSPSFVKTHMLDETEKTVSSDTISELEKRHPLGFGTPKDVAMSAIFLLSEASRWITAENITLGGFIETKKPE